MPGQDYSHLVANEYVDDLINSLFISLAVTIQPHYFLFSRWRGREKARSVSAIPRPSLNVGDALEVAVTTLGMVQNAAVIMRPILAAKYLGRTQRDPTRRRRSVLRHTLGTTIMREIFCELMHRDRSFLDDGNDRPSLLLVGEKWYGMHLPYI